MIVEARLRTVGEERRVAPIFVKYGFSQMKP